MPADDVFVDQPLPPGGGGRAMTDRALLKGLWILLGATLVFSAVDFFRLDVSLGATTYDIYNAAHLDIGMLVVVAISGLVCLMVLMRGGRVRLERSDGSIRRVLAFLCAFCVWHVISLAWTHEANVGLREAVKIAAGLGVLTLIVLLVPASESVPERFWTAAIWVAAAFFGGMAYYSWQKWHVAMLSTELDEQTIGGRNQIAAALAYLLPMSAAYAWGARGRLWRYVPFITLAIVLLYSGSRGGGISSACGLTAMALGHGRVEGWGRAARKTGLALALLAGLVSVLIVSLNYNGSEIGRRWYYFYDPSAVPELHSFESRGMRLQLGLRMVAERPLFGWGRGATARIMGTVPHNDYVTVIAELGVIGGALFLGTLGSIAWHLLRLDRRVRHRWAYFGSQGAFVALLAFMMTMDRISSTIAFWIVMGMSIVACDPAPEV